MFGGTLVIINNTKISALVVNQIEFRRDCELCTMSNIIRAYSTSTAAASVLATNASEMAGTLSFFLGKM